MAHIAAGHLEGPINYKVTLDPPMSMFSFAFIPFSSGTGHL